MQACFSVYLVEFVSQNREFGMRCSSAAFRGSSRPSINFHVCQFVKYAKVTSVTDHFSPLCRLPSLTDLRPSGPAPSFPQIPFLTLILSPLVNADRVNSNMKIATDYGLPSTHS